MSNSNDHLHEIACPQCAKRLKASSSHLGKKLKCPHCSAFFKVPGTIQRASDDADWLKLDGDPPINSNQQQPVAHPSANVRRTKSSESSHKPNEKPTKSPQSRQNLPSRPKVDETTAPRSAPSVPKTPASSDKSAPHSVFDAMDVSLLKEESHHNQAQATAKAKPASLSAKTNSPAASNVQAPSIKDSGSQKPRSAKPLIMDDVDIPPLDVDSANGIRFAVDPEMEGEFRVECKVCHTHQYVTLSKVGGLLRCPDCFTEFIVPKPSAGWDAKESALKNAVPRYEKTVQPSNSVGDKRSERTTTERTAREYLENARVALQEDDEKDDLIAVDFDTNAWLIRTFSFLRDPGVIVVAFITGAIWGTSLLVSSIMLATDETGFAKVFTVLALGGVSLPTLTATLANGLAILLTAANQMKRVEEWPVMHLAEWMGQSAMVVLAVALAGFPGAAVGFLLNMFDVHPIVEIGLLLISIWLLLPPVLLSMMDNQSPFQPFSADVFRSLQTHQENWGGMYMMTGLAAAFGLGAFIVLFRGGPIGLGCFGLLAPWIIFFVFHQMGAHIAMMGMAKSGSEKFVE